MSSPEQLTCKEQEVCKEREVQEEQEVWQKQDFRSRIEIKEVESDYDNIALQAQVSDKPQRQSPEIPSVSASVEYDITKTASDEARIPHLQFTVPEPFKFHKTRTHCKQSIEQKSPYVPLATRIRELVEKTPERFKSHVVSKQSHHVFHQIPLTRPKPFTLQTAIRGEHYKDLFQQRIEELRQREKENQFRATPLPSLDPDIPKKPELRPPTEPVDFYFLTEERIKHHKLLDQERKQREEDYDNLRLKRLKEEERRKEKELRRLRKERVLRARPIMKYRPIIIMPSKKKLTKAKSPMIGEKRKRHMQYLQESALDSLNGSRSVSAMSLHSEQ